jgi:hypothetical protein
MRGETIADFAQRASVEFGYWSELSREVAVELEKEGFDPAAAWAAKRTWENASRKVLTLAEDAS